MLSRLERPQNWAVVEGMATHRQERMMMMMMMMTMMMMMSCWGVYYDKASSGASHSSKRYLGTLPPHPVTSTKYPTEIKPHIVDSIGKGAYIAILLCLISICCHTRCPKG